MDKKINTEQLQFIIDKLLDDQEGCQWDLAQTPETLAKYTLEETHELLYAIGQNDHENTKEELGDLLFHIFFYGKIAEKNNHYSTQAVIDHVCEKMITRHPHIFKDQVYLSSEEQENAWRDMKKSKEEPTSFFSKEKQAYLPSFLQSIYLQKEMGIMGFDWPSVEPVIDKVYEETKELQNELNQPQRAFEEYGDLLFTVVNLGRKLNIDPDLALRAANTKFSNRCNQMLKLIESKHQFKSLTINEQTDLWNQVKREQETGK